MNIFEVFATISLDDKGFSKGIDNAISKGASFNDKFNSAMINVANAAQIGLGSANAAFSKLADAANSVFSVMPDSILTDSLNNIQAYWDDWLANRKAQIDEELSLEASRLNSIIDSINSEIAARRNARNSEIAVENAETKLRSANSAVSDAQKDLARAEAELAYARDDNARIEAEKLIAQKQIALSAALDALTKAQRNYDDQLWFAEKNAQIANAQTQIADAQAAANLAKLNAEQYANDSLNYSINSLYQQHAEQQSAATAKIASDTAKHVALSAAGIALSAAAGISKSAQLYVTYTNAAATSGQVANLLQKTLDNL